LLFHFLYKDVYTRRAKVYTDGLNYLLFHEGMNEPMWLWISTMCEQDDMERLLQIVLEQLSSFPDIKIVVNALIGKELIALSKEKLDLYVLLYKELNVYLCDTPVQPLKKDGFLRLAEEKDIAVIVKHRLDEVKNLNEYNRSAADIEEAVRASIQRRNTYLWIDPAQKLITIACIGYEDEKTARLEGVYTIPGFRGHGYASILLYEIMRRMQQKGKACILYTDSDNEAANLCYKNVGFKKIGTLNGLHFKK